MFMENADRIEREGVKLLEEFSMKLKDIRETDETHYVVDLKNVWRKDEEPVRTEGFRDRLGKLAPAFREGYVMTEKPGN
jgi:predicted Asp-tRNA(Asn)/Glu-tRNA(Gln) amidotransferase subunit C